MTRIPLLLLGVVCCAFGGVSLATEGATSNVAYGINIVLALLLMVLTYQDLRKRGFTWQAWVVAALFLLPLLGLLAYAVASARPLLVDEARDPAPDRAPA